MVLGSKKRELKSNVERKKQKMERPNYEVLVYSKIIVLVAL
jgi:hypothetical protein